MGFSGSVQIAKLLIKKGAEINPQVPEGTVSALSEWKCTECCACYSFVMIQDHIISQLLISIN